MDRDSCIAFIEHDYFGSVSAGDLDATMACFTEDARVVIRNGDQAVRRFAVQSTADAVPLEDFYRHLCGNYAAWFGDFWHVVDTAAARAASRFTVRLAPKTDGRYADAGEQTLLNCNFFEFDGAKIRDMIIYYANPGSAGLTPTGYPQG